MKKTTLAILMLIITCSTTNLYAIEIKANVYTRSNKFYSTKPYCYSSWYGYEYKLYFQFIHTMENNKTYLRVKRRIYDEVLIGNNDYIIIIFKDGQEYRLDYCTELFHKKQPKDSNYADYWEIEAIGEIDYFNRIDRIIIIQNGYYYEDSISIKDTNNEELFVIYAYLSLEIDKLKN